MRKTQPIRFAFDFRKTLQAAAVLAKLEPCEIISRMRLLKLLYIADRDALRETGSPITGDKLAALQNGPILSGLYAIIRGETQRSAVFEKYFAAVGYYVKLRKSPGLGALNRWEIRKLKAISERFKGTDDWALSEVSHGFPEWQKNNPGQSSRPIPVEDVLEAVGMADRAQKIAVSAQRAKAIAELWS
ncbi:MAG TPA: Panacea domain-containing protein [Planctomycetota bacterium]